MSILRLTDADSDHQYIVDLLIVAAPFVEFVLENDVGLPMEDGARL